MIWGQHQEKNSIFISLVSKTGNLIQELNINEIPTDSVLEPLVPKVDKVEDYIDIKASNILMDSDKYR